MADVDVRPAGDSALVLTLAARIDPAINARAIAIAETVRTRCGAAVQDVVVGYHTVTAYFDPLASEHRQIEQEMRAAAAAVTVVEVERGRLIEVPVCYDAAFGADLDEVAAVAGVAPEEIVRVHTAREYRVFVVGFVPGFAYMGPVDAQLALPRRATPRTRVPPGSVAVAAGQTGIYPMETPGGWHILGRTPIRPFDPARPEPVLFRPGDRVRFVPITRQEYDRTAEW